MKKTLILTALAAATVAPAFAQSSVTVYGRLNVTVESRKTGNTTDKGVYDNSSRIGFKGVEDLGGGLKAGFLIEHGFNAASGQAAGTFWGRESNVWLSGSFGKLRLGNMGPNMAYFTLADYISNHNHDTGISSDAFYLYPGRGSNMVAYTSPSLGGLTIDAQVAEKRVGDLGRTVVLTGNYEGGPLHLGASYEKDGDHRELGVRGAYDIGAATLGAYYIRNSDIGGVAGADRTSWRLSGMYTMGATELHLNYGKAGEIGGVANTDATQVTLGVNYNLSKRTKVYGFYTKVNNEAAAAYYSTGAGADVSSLALGVRHNF
ncbi:porin [Ideonella sp. 4Y11]|uniref:Porin n=1 Tax=Ideonella aquatica TaxID=2824119 RepID=A0A940YMH4_9BURK|nr:porin [Ideonella aquatica]MBQ0960651.1 porin [Ideonella aquatica]